MEFTATVSAQSSLGPLFSFKFDFDNDQTFDHASGNENAYTYTTTHTFTSSSRTKVTVYHVDSSGRNPVFVGEASVDVTVAEGTTVNVYGEDVFVPDGFASYAAGICIGTKEPSPTPGQGPVIGGITFGGPCCESDVCQNPTSSAN